MRKMVFFLFLSLYLMPVCGFAQEGRSVATEVVVQPKKWSVGRLRNVPENAQIDLGIDAEGELTFLILNAQEYKIFPKVRNPTLLMALNNRLTLTAQLKQAGSYYLMFWNKDQAEPIHIKFFARIKSAPLP